MITVTVVSVSKYSLENDKCYLNTFVNFFLSIQDKLSLEGIVVQRAECRPAANENYMRLKRLQIEESSKPVRLSQQLDKVVTTNYKPVANHQYNVSLHVVLHSGLSLMS